MNKNNYIFYAIIIYIIIITLLIIIKPNIIYDHDKFKFKKFGYTKDKSMFPIGILAIILAVAIIIIFSLFGNNNSNNKHNDAISESDELKIYKKLFGGNLPAHFNNIPYQYLPYVPYILNHQLQHVIQPQIIPQQIQEILQTKS
jgi:hypothetical protein